MFLKVLRLLFVLVIIFTTACSSNDDTMTPVIIEALNDNVTVSQNSEVEIFIFANDTNIPNSGELSITTPSKGMAIIIDENSTPNNPSDDFIKFSPNANETGTDSFEYTICNNGNTCQTATVNITITSSSSVNFDLDSMPFQSLSEYQLFEGELSLLEPSFGVVPYELISSLFTDYAKKKRYIWMPNNTKASYEGDAAMLNFPVGTIIVKNFYYDNVLPENDTKIIETRLLIRKPEGWIFAEYVWNDAQTEAFLDMNGSYVDIEWTQDGETKSTSYRIPSGPECFTCHKVQEVAQPIGPKPRNLNKTLEFADGNFNQLEKLIAMGYLENNVPSNVSAVPDYRDVSEPLELRARAYLDINCAHCHSEGTHCDYRPMRLDFESTSDPTNIGVCVSPDTDLGLGLGDIVIPGDPRNSVLHFRMNSNEPSNRMPLLGRNIIHTEGVALIEQWIENLSIDCD